MWLFSLSSRRIAVIVFFLSVSTFSFSQNSVSIGTTSTNPKAVLWLSGTNQGIIIPIVTNKTNVSAGPTEKGMVVFDDSDKKVYFFDGSAWNQVGGSGAAGSQGIAINGNTVQLNSTAGATFGLSNTAPTGKGQLLVWDGSKWDATIAPTTTGQTLSWDNTNGRWTLANASLTLAGDVSGPSNNTTIASTSGNNIVAALNNGATTSKILPAQISAGTPNQVLTTSAGNVAVWANLPTASGTVTTIATGTGLTGGPITTTGTIALANTSVVPGTYGSTTQIPQIAVDAQGRITSASNVNPALAGTSTTGFLSNTDWNTFNNKLAGTLTNGNIFVGNASNVATGVAMSGDAFISNTGALTIQPNRITSAKILDGEIVDADINTSANIADTKLATISTAGKVSGGAITSGTIGGSTNINTTGNVAATNLSGNGSAITNLNAGNLASGTVPTARLDVGTTANKIVQLDGTGKLPILDGSQLINLPAGTETDPTVTAINGLVKSNGTTISAATAGTDYLAPNGNGSALTNLNATNISSGTLAIANGGTGATTAPAARTALGLGTLSTLSAVTSSEITDGTIVDADINGTANINGAKINPSFGAQAVSTTSTLTTGSSGQFVINASGNITKINNVTTSFPAAQGLANSVLTNDGSGNLSWTPNNNWGLTGNAGTNGATNFIGTTDAQPLVLRSNNTEGIRIGTDGGVSISEDVLSNRKIVFYDITGNTNQIIGFGLNPAVLRYQVDQTTTSHVFYAGTSPTTSNELFRIQGDGNVGVGNPSPTAKLDIAGNIKITDGTQGANKVLTSDANGLASWQAVAGTGTVTSVSAGTGLTGGPITSSGTLAVDVGTGANQIVQLDGTGKLPAIDGSQLLNLPAGTETDPTVTAINGLVKSNGTVISAATAGTDYLAPNGNGSALTNLNANNISSGTLAITNGGTGATTAPAARTALGLGTLATLNTVGSAEITDASIGVADLNPAAGILTNGSSPNSVGDVVGDFASGLTLQNNAPTGANIANVLNTNGAYNLTTTGTLSTGAATVTGLTIGSSVWPANASGSLTNDGSGNLTWVPSGGSGTVTSITRGAGLVAGPAITTSGTLDVNVGTGANQIVQLDGTAKLPAIDGSQLLNLPAGTETDPTVTAINGLVKSNGTTISAATAGTDYLAPNGNGSALTNLNATNISSGTLAIANGGTGATTAPAARTALGLGTLSTLSAVTSSEITDGTIVDADINGTANINGAKINPTFGAQAVSTTSTLTTGTAGQFVVDATGNITKIRNIATSFPSTQGAANSVLTNDGAGNLTWAAGSGWGLNGNTLVGGEKIGSTNGNPIPFITNNVERMRIDPSGNVGIGTTSPTQPLHVEGPEGQFLVTPNLSGPGATSLMAQLLNTASKGPQVRFAGAVGGAAWNDIGQDATGNFVIEASDVPLLTLNQNGALGVGSTPSYGTSGFVLTSNGSGGAPIWQAVSGTGTVTSVGAGTGLVGGPITTSGTLSVDVGTGANQIVQLDGTGKLPAIDGSQLLNLPAGTETDPTVTAINGLVKSNGTTISAATAGTDYLAPNGNGSALTNLNATNISSGTLAIVNGGTGATTAPAARTALGLGTLSTLSAVTSSEITDGTIVDADINGTANINGAKINPSFGAQAVSTTSTLTTGTAGQFVVDATGNVTKINNITTSFPATQGAANSVLTNDGAGNLSWATSSGWGLNGNATTVGNKLGTTNGNALTFITSNTDRMTIDATGNVGIGTTSPTAPLTISGTTSMIDVTNTGGGQNWRIVSDTDGTLKFVKTSGLTFPPLTLNGNGAIGIYDGVSAVTFGTPGQVLTSGGSGAVPTWTNASGGWTLGGTAGTVDGIPGTGTNYIGTTDAVPLNFMVNNTRAGRIDPTVFSTFFGFSSGQNNAGISNTGIGNFSLAQNTSGSGNTALGASSLSGTTTGVDNTAVGNGALFFNSTGSGNAAFGNAALSNSSNASGNTAMGNESLLFTSTGQNNTAIGRSSGITNTIGSNNSFLGHGADATVNNLTNATAIGYNAKVATSNTLVLGGTGADAVNVGIGTTSPAQKLSVQGGMNVDNGDAATGSIANGLTFGFGSSEGISSKRNPGGNQFGLDFYTQTVNRLSITNTGNVGVGNTTPTEKLDVTGNLKFSGALMPNNLPGTAGQVLTSAGPGLPPTWSPGSTTTASNGLTKTVNDIALGGTLTGQTDINRAGNDFNIIGSGNFGVRTGPPGTDRLFVDGATGNVGIGTTGPSQALSVSGGIIVDHAGSNNGVFVQSQVLQFGTGSGEGIGSSRQPGQETLDFYTGAAKQMTIKKTGNIGIGTDSPLTLLQIGGTLGFFNAGGDDIISHGIYFDGSNFINRSTAENSAILLGDGKAGIYTFPAGAAAGVASSPSMRFNVRPTGVGIQVDNPIETFQVNGATYLNPITAPGVTTDRLYNVGGNLFWNGTNISSGSSGWSLSGNGGTNSATDFIGTTDNIALRFKTNNVNSGLIDPLNSNAFFGYSAGLTTTGTQNVAVGTNALIANVNGSGNVALGTGALQTNISGTGNVAIGNFADVNSPGLINAIAIGRNAKVNTSNSMVLGGTGGDAVNVGIGTTQPVSDLQITTATHLFDFPSGSGFAHNIRESGGNLLHTTAGGASVLGLEPSKAGLYVNSTAAANASFGTSLANRMVLTETGLSVNKDAAHNSAVLHVVSETTAGGGTPRGFMMPAVITADRDAIPAPLTGLMVFNQTTNAFNFYNGTNWAPISGASLNAGLGLTLNGSNLDLGATNMPTATTFQGAGDNMLEIQSSNSALGTKAGIHFKMFQSAINTQYEIFTRKMDAIPNSGNSDLVMTKVFSTAGGYLDAFTIDNGTNNVIINNDKTTAANYGNFIVRNGNTGIGTTTPSSKLHVSGTTSVASRAAGTLLDVNTTLTDNNSYMRFSQDGTNLQNPVFVGVDFDNGISEFWNQDGMDMRFGTNNIERVRITNTGNVGIGVTNPVTGLDVFSNNGIRLNSYLGAGSTASGSAYLGANLYQGYANNFWYWANTNGSVGGAAIGLNSSAASNSIQFFRAAGPSTANALAGSLQESMRIDASGNVGIGTTNPNGFSGKILHLSGTGNTGYILEKTDATPRKWGMVLGGSGEYVIQDMTAGGVNPFLMQPGVIAGQLYMKAGGFTGINNSNPLAPLDVAATSNIFLSTGPNVFFNSFQGGTLSTGLNPTPSVAVRATGAFLSIGTGEAAGYYVQSDERIKRKVGVSDSRNDLSTLMKIKITDYKYTDSLNSGNVQVKGVFAQEVEKVYPQAISKQTNWIPNVYALANHVEFDDAKQALTVTMAKPHNLVVGDKVKLISSTSGEKPSVVASVDGNTFTVSNWTEKSEKIFVFGKEVNDFRIVDYDRLFTLNISATQELVKLVEEQKKVIDELKAKEEENKKKIAQLETSLNKAATSENELASLKSEIEKIKAALGLSVDAALPKKEEKK